MMVTGTKNHFDTCSKCTRYVHNVPLCLLVWLVYLVYIHSIKSVTELHTNIIVKSTVCTPWGRVNLGVRQELIYLVSFAQHSECAQSTAIVLWLLHYTGQ